MAKKESKRQKFHEALLNIYLPPPPPPPSPLHISQVEEDEVTELVPEKLDTTSVLGTSVLAYGGDTEECSCFDDSDSSLQKLTRAQRKRIRKRKLKEAASSRRKIIGPLLPSESETQDHKEKQAEFCLDKEELHAEAEAEAEDHRQHCEGVLRRARKRRRKKQAVALIAVKREVVKQISR